MAVQVATVILDFDNRALADATFHTVGDATVISFKDGQSVMATDVQDVQFTDGHHKL